MFKFIAGLFLGFLIGVSYNAPPETVTPDDHVQVQFRK